MAITLLSQIQDAAVDSGSDLGQVLRMCKVLATRLDSRPLDQWLIRESEGYPRDVDVPSYRTWQMQLKGHFSGPFQSGLRNAPIPHVCLPENVREQYSTFHCRQSVSSIAELLKQHKDGPLHITVGDLAVLLEDRVWDNMTCMQAWGEIGAGQLVEVLNTVRNKILDFALALGKEFPQLLSDSTATQTIAVERTTQIFNTTVYGGTLGMIGPATHSNLTAVSVNKEDFKSLASHLATAGVSAEDLKLLQKALDKDAPPTSTGNFGSQVSDWIAQMTKKAASGVWDVSLSVAGSLLSEALSRYYGINS